MQSMTGLSANLIFFNRLLGWSSTSQKRYWDRRWLSFSIRDDERWRQTGSSELCSEMVSSQCHSYENKMIEKALLKIQSQINNDSYSSPCRCPFSIMINPTFSSLSIKYPAAKFLIVDTDKCEVCMMIVILLPLRFKVHLFHTIYIKLTWKEK